MLMLDPEVQYTVDEIMDSPEDYTNEEINLRGTSFEVHGTKNRKFLSLKEQKQSYL